MLIFCIKVDDAEAPKEEKPKKKRATKSNGKAKKVRISPVPSLYVVDFDGLLCTGRK